MRMSLGAATAVPDSGGRLASPLYVRGAAVSAATALSNPTSRLCSTCGPRLQRRAGQLHQRPGGQSDGAGGAGAAPAGAGKGRAAPWRACWVRAPVQGLCSCMVPSAACDAWSCKAALPGKQRSGANPHTHGCPAAVPRPSCCSNERWKWRAASWAAADHGCSSLSRSCRWAGRCGHSAF